jgi:hypothetical protein
VIALVDKLRLQFEELRGKLIQSRADVAKLNANYDAKRSDFDAYFKEQDAGRQALIDQTISVRTQISALLTESEWQAIHKFGVEALNANIKALAS